MDLKEIWLTALAQCAPDVVVQKHVNASMPRNVVAIGKCAGAMLDGVAQVLDLESAFVAIPEGYRLPRAWAGPRARRSGENDLQVHIGGHPHITPASFAAGRALLEYVDRHDDILFLISGGGSACVEVADDEARVIEANAKLIASGRPIGEINVERRKWSAIKGGKLGDRVRRRKVALVYSDVSTNAPNDVASGLVRDPIVIADNTTLVRAAAQIIGDNAVVVDEQLEGDVLHVAALLASRAAGLKEGQILVAGGEPTVMVRGSGRGGRCSELAVRFASRSACEALFASSDGVDGSSGVAGFHLPPRPTPRKPAGSDAALADSDSFRIAAQLGEPLTIAATGNNLRDLFLIARLQACVSQAGATVQPPSR